MNSIKFIPTEVQPEFVDDRLHLNGSTFTLDGDEFQIDGNPFFVNQTPNWGNKETQVQTIGKHTNIASDELFSTETGEDKVKWRFDEEYFCIQHKNRLFIFNEDGDLYSKHEHPIANTICWYKHRVMTVQRRRNRLYCVFVEPNGLEHGSFIIPYTDYTVADMQVNEDQTIVFMEIKSMNSSDRLLLIWICMNSEWYISNTVHLSSIKWHVVENSINFTSKSRSLSFELLLSVVASHAQIGVINGKSVMFTNTKLGCIPPPYCHSIIEYDEEIVGCCLDESVLYAVSRSHLYIKNTNYLNGFNTPVKYDRKIPLPAALFIASIFALDDKYFVSAIDDELKPILIHYDNGFSLIQHPWCVDVCFNIECSLISTEVVLFSSQKSVCNIPFKPVKAICYGSVYYILSSDGILYSFVRDFKKITSKVSSFILYKHFLVCSTTTDDLVIYDTSNIKSSYTRPIEHGSTIIDCHDDLLLVQLPRGNLESFSPRPFVISSIYSFIADKNLDAAVELSREHRIDFNLFFDINIFDISITASLIVDQCTPDRINLISTSLNSKNCLKELYLEESNFLGFSGVIAKNKVKKVLAAIRNALATKNTVDYVKWPLGDLQSLLTAYVRDDSNIEKGLLIIHSTMSDHQLALSLLQYCIFLTSKTVLFSKAYETYDLVFVQFVARHCGIDPQEYLPFIEELKELSVEEQKYRIDVQIEEFGRATTHLLESKKDYHSMIIKHVVHYSSFKHPIKYMIDFNRNHSCWIDIWSLYGEYLQEKRHSLPAGICYYMSKNYKKAMEAFAEHKYYISSALCSQDSSEDLLDILEIFEDYQGIFQVMSLLRMDSNDASVFNDFDPFLTFYLTENNKMMFTKLQILEAEISSYSLKLNTMVADIDTCRQLMETKLDLLENENEFMDFDDVGSMGSQDTNRSTLLSQVTGLSRLTFKTGKTGKSKRKSEKKKQSGRRKGTIYEEVYIINEFIKLVNIFNDKLVEYQQFHCQLFLASLFKEAMGFYTCVYNCYQLIYDSKKFFDYSLFSKQMTILGRSNAVTKQDLSEYAASVCKPLDFPKIAPKPVWLHFQ
eukprot:NODE_350_length_10400_cov_0.385205.p1 type:complete len:1067 gc:universal NODE_350_length_10400_cov_0.385205:9692-6492(-)